MRKNALLCALVVLVMTLCALAGSAATIYVKSNSPYNGPGNDWDHAFHTIQAGLDAAGPNDTVLVSPGSSFVYSENIVVNKQGIQLEASPMGFVTINGSGSTATVILSGTYGATIKGFTITGGVSGIECHTPSYILNNTITGNNGRGIYISDLSVGNPVIRYNSITYNVGGIYASRCTPLIGSNVIAHNTATLGGGIYFDQCTSGSGIRCYNNTFAYNTAAIEGGGIYNYFTWPFVVNCIFVGNSAPDGGAFYNQTYSGGGDVSNCDFYENGQYPWGPPHDWSPIGLDGNIATNPQLLSTTDYRLQAGSPCVGTGGNPAPFAGATDIAGLPRTLPVGGVVDMGAYEGASVLAFTKIVGDWVELRDIPVTLGISNGQLPSWGFNYVEEATRIRGIRVLPMTGTGRLPNYQDHITTLAGQVVMNDDNPAILPVWYFGSMTACSTGPMGMANKTLGVLNQGIRVRVWGKVTDSGCGYFSLTDGSGDSVLVFWTGQTYTVNDYVAVTGVHASEGVYATAVDYYTTVEQEQMRMASGSTTAAVRRCIDEAPKPPTPEELAKIRAKKR